MNLLGGLRETGDLPLFSPKGRTYSPPAKQAVVSLPLVGLVRSSRTVLQPFLQRGAGNAASGHSLCRRLYVLPNQQNDEVAYCNPIPPPAYENSAQDNPSDMSGQLYRSDRYVVFSDTPIFSFGKEKQKNERTVKTNGDLSFRSKSS